MKKVFADKELDYSESEIFDVPEEYENPCISRKKRVENEPVINRNTVIDDFF